MKLIILALGLIILSTSSFAGNERGNGGNVVVCRNSKGKVISTQLFDLYEGHALYGLTYNESAADHIKQAVEIGLKIDEALGTRNVDGGRNFVTDEILSIHRRVRMLPAGVGLEPINDSHQFIVPKSCSIIQLANYRDDGEVFLDSDNWNLLSETNKAALLVHEALYFHLRWGVDTNSIRTRKAIALFFSGQSFPKVHKHVDVNSKIETCTTFDAFESGRPESTFSSYLNSKGKVVIQFGKLAGHTLVSRTTLTSTINEARGWPFFNNNIVGVSGKLGSLIDSDKYVEIRRARNALILIVRFPDGKVIEEKLECSMN